MKVQTKTPPRKTPPSNPGKGNTAKLNTAKGATAKGGRTRGERVFRLPDGTRSVQSPWIWRGFLFLSLIAFGLCLSFVFADRVFYAASWGFITAGWFAISMWLWRRHVRDDDEWRARQRSDRTA
jgi:hypothetical protein